MACFMACHACHARTQPLLLLSRAILQPNSTPIALSGIISLFDSLSPHLIGGHNKLGKRQEADHMMRDGLGSRCVHRSLTQIRAASVRDPCRHTGHENEAAWRSVLPTFRGHAFESLAQWALSATTEASPCRSWWLPAWPRRAQYRHCVWCHWRRHGTHYDL